MRIILIYKDAIVLTLNLKEAATGQWHRIQATSAPHQRMEELGFLPMEKVKVLRRSWFNKGALVVQVGDAVFALRPGEAQMVTLEPTA
jgi:Fe2+ transport system protein FeoA